jgi:hypothetical protein
MVAPSKDARDYPISPIVPSSGTGIQLVHSRTQRYTVWNNGEIEQFCYTKNDAYFVLQEVLDELRTGLDWDEPEDDEDDEGLF